MLRIRDFIKYDWPNMMLPFSLVFLLIFSAQYWMKKYNNGLTNLGKLFRTGWPGSKYFPTLFTKLLFNNKNIQFMTEFREQVLRTIEPTTTTQKFFDDPSRLFRSIVIVLKSYSPTSKGLIIIKYSNYFPLFFKLFDVNSIADKYHIVLEPSWAGLCEPNILLFATINKPVFVMAYEARDNEFINAINTNLTPIDTGANWWVDYRKFSDENHEFDRDIDLIVVAKWSEFKRYYYIFKALQTVKLSLENIKIVIVGYTGDQTLNQIKEMARKFNLEDNITTYEWLPPSEVADLLVRSKINLLWSRFEGDKRSIIEGMFCNTPCILREGNNYGQRYDYINPETGDWANEKTLPNRICKMLKKDFKINPRKYVLENHNCHIAIRTIQTAIGKVDNSFIDVPIDNFEMKINELNGMQYFNPLAEINFTSDYDSLSNSINLN
ncbi:MAG: glycosyltransferase involved in cell wall biosynthesis [Psychromonas sp.]|jgi:glycosyltransferase involved in cell wall biosynthesis